MPSLFNFEILPPTYVSSQETTLNWLFAAHMRAEAEDNFRETLSHVSCKQIDKRGHHIDDFNHLEWDKMKVYSNVKGLSLEGRQKLHAIIVEEAFSKYYKDNKNFPDEIIHVSCTGYASPSGAQKMASQIKAKAFITHLYHMGCYAAIPAVRLGANSRNGRCDIVHTELCTLHLNPSNHGKDQLVVQSLFADGIIKYSIQEDVKGPHLKLVTTHEMLIPDSLEAMKWLIGDFGFQFTLSKEIPVLINRSVVQFTQEIAQKADISFDTLVKEAIFAIHPGGPKIIDYIQKTLSLKEVQVASSRHILKEHGNMSSATLPHIWKDILDVKNKTYVVSLAFGPGLTIAGNILSCGY